MYKNISEHPLILASSSPRRKELLETCGLKFSIIKPECDETVLPGEEVEGMVRRLSIEKAHDVAVKNKEAWILAADTTVYIGKEILGKPLDEAEAFQMLQKISGNWHKVWGGITLCNLHKNIAETYTSCTEVLMRKLNEEEIREFIASGEPMDKAGAYAIQGLGASLVAEIKGSYTNVVGLNLSLVIESLIRNLVIA